MRIKKIILKGYKRFLLSNIDTLEYTPNHTIQMIASRNLAGKSSLLRQLNPLPADIKKDFKEGGYKHIEIEHTGNEYKLISKGKHNFICNGKELNPGGTRKVQLELVKEHFGITPAIMDVIYNIDKITTMSPADRKKWFTEMSNVDYKFPIHAFKLMKQTQRDATGGIKLLQDNLIQSNLNKLEKTQLEKLKEDRAVLEKYITHIISLYDNNVSNSEDKGIEENINRLNKELEEIINNNYNTDITIQEVKENIKKVELEQSIIKTKVESISKELDIIDKVVSVGDKEATEQSIVEIKDKLEKLLNTVYLENKDSDFELIYNDLTLIHGDVVTSAGLFSEYKNIRILDKTTKDGIVSDYNNLSIKINSLNNIINLTEKELEHINKHKTEEHLINCPKCSHSWYLGYDENRVKEINVLLDKYKKEKEELEKSYTKLEKDVLAIKEYNEQLDKFKNLLRIYPTTIPVWKSVFMDMSINTCSEQEFLTKLNMVTLALQEWRKIPVYKEELKKLEDTLRNIKEINKLHKDANKDKRDSLIKELNDLTKLSNDTIREINRLKDDLDIKKRVADIYNELLENTIKYRKGLANEIKTERNKFLSELVNLLKEELVKIDTLINDASRIDTNIEKDTKQLNHYKLREKVLGLMAKELSPDEGLIAKSINSFINVIITEMNNVINSIWTYDLEILPCEVNEENDLDYKFKVKINNDHVVEDISKLSSSGQEIVELAFRLVFTKYMGLIDIPLYLDEFGSTFDKAHRASAYRVIDKIISADYQQIFIICHYSDIYGSLVNVDFNVLDSNNIDLDNTISVNEVMKIVRE